jgi:hypothetical protein
MTNLEKAADLERRAKLVGDQAIAAEMMMQAHRLRKAAADGKPQTATDPVEVDALRRIADDYEYRARRCPDPAQARHLLKAAHDARNAPAIHESLLERARLRRELQNVVMGHEHGPTLHDSIRQKISDLEGQYPEGFLDLVDQLVTGLFVIPASPWYWDAAAVASRIRAQNARRLAAQ